MTPARRIAGAVSTIAMIAITIGEPVSSKAKNRKAIALIAEPIFETLWPSHSFVKSLFCRIVLKPPLALSSRSLVSEIEESSAASTIVTSPLYFSFSLNYVNDVQWILPF